MPQLSDDPEDIRAALRKIHGTLARFERARNLPSTSARDVLRGRAVTQTAQAIADELGATVELLFPGRFKSHNRDNSQTAAASHFQNAEAR
jgi:lambda repressor-like predicted transcriptional regulator